MPLAMLMKTTRLIMASALQTALKELSPSCRDLPAQARGRSCLLSLRPVLGRRYALNCVVTRQTSSLLHLGHLQESPGMVPPQSWRQGWVSTGRNGSIPVLSLLFLSSNYQVVSTVKYSFSLSLLCHRNTAERSAGKTNYSGKAVWPQEEVSSA